MSHVGNCLSDSKQASLFTRCDISRRETYCNEFIVKLLTSSAVLDQDCITQGFLC